MARPCGDPVRRRKAARPRSTWSLPSRHASALSDGADGPRSLGVVANVGPTFHVLDWFHCKRGKTVGTQAPHTANANDQIGDRNENISVATSQAGRSLALT